MHGARQTCLEAGFRPVKLRGPALSSFSSLQAMALIKHFLVGDAKWLGFVNGLEDCGLRTGVIEARSTKECIAQGGPAEPGWHLLINYDTLLYTAQIALLNDV